MDNIKLFYSLTEPKSLWLLYSEEEAQRYKVDMDHLQQSLTELQGHKACSMINFSTWMAYFMERRTWKNILKLI